MTKSTLRHISLHKIISMRRMITSARAFDSLHLEECLKYPDHIHMMTRNVSQDFEVEEFTSKSDSNQNILPHLELDFDKIGIGTHFLT